MLDVILLLHWRILSYTSPKAIHLPSSTRALCVFRTGKEVIDVSKERSWHYRISKISRSCNQTRWNSAKFFSLQLFRCCDILVDLPAFWTFFTSKLSRFCFFEERSEIWNSKDWCCQTTANIFRIVQKRKDFTLGNTLNLCSILMLLWHVARLLVTRSRKSVMRCHRTTRNLIGKTAHTWASFILGKFFN